MDSQININFKESGGPLSMSYFAESSPDGTGVSFENLELEINEASTLYAIKRDSSGRYVENTAVSWSKVGSIGSLTIIGSGEAAEFMSPDVGSAQIKILDDGEVVKVVEVTVSYPPSSPVDIETLAISNITDDGFNASLAFAGDYEENSVHTLYYCNQSSSACDPETDGGSVVMTRGSSEMTAAVSGLTLPADDFAVRLISEDVDGVIGTATQDTVITLNGTPLEISNFSFLNASKDGGDVRVSASGDLEENAAVSLFYCDEDADASCDPELGTEVTMTRTGSYYEANLSGLSGSFSEGTKLKFRIVATDSDGTDGSPMDSADYLADLRLSDVSFFNEKATAFDVRVNAQ